MPVGPHILWLLATSQSAPSFCTSTGMCGMLWQASARTFAPTAWAFSATHEIGFTQPRTLETWDMATSLVRSLSRLSKWSRSSIPSAVSLQYFTVAPFSSASICHGTMLE